MKKLHAAHPQVNASAYISKCLREFKLERRSISAILSFCFLMF